MALTNKKKKIKDLGIEMRVQSTDKIVLNGNDGILSEFKYILFCIPSFAANTSTTIY
jgi:hypothetical protein